MSHVVSINCKWMLLKRGLSVDTGVIRPSHIYHWWRHERALASMSSRNSSYPALKQNVKVIDIGEVNL